MRTVTDSFADSIRSDFRMACLELARAERAVRDSATPETEDRLRWCREQVDAVLDMWNDATGGPA